MSDSKLQEQAERLAFEIAFKSKQYNNFGKVILIIEVFYFFLKLIKKEPDTILVILKTLGTESR